MFDSMTIHCGLQATPCHVPLARNLGVSPAGTVHATGPTPLGRRRATTHVAVPRDRVRLRPSPSKWTSFRVRTPEQGPKSHSAGAVGKNLPPDSGSASGRAVVAGSALRARRGTRYARGGASRPRRARQPKLFGRAARVLCLRFSSTGAWRGTKLWCERRAAGAEPGCRTG